MAITYSLELDLDRNGLFQNSGGHIGDRLIAANWLLGMSNSMNQMSQPLMVVITVHDPNLDFSQDTNGSLYGAVVREVLVRIKATVNRNTTTIVTGWITHVSSEDRANGAVSVLTVECKTLQLQDAEYLPTVGTSVRVDTEMQNIFDSGLGSYPYEKNYWTMDAARLNEDAILFESQITDFEAAQTTLDWVGDAADRGFGVSALGYMMDLLWAEVGGRFFVNRSGKFAFHNRYHDLDEAVADTFTDAEYDDFRLVTGEVFNEMVVNYHPREEGAANTVLFLSENVPITIGPGANVEIIGRYRDVNNENATIGGYNITTPVLTTDYKANSAEDGSGTDVELLLKWSFETKGTATKFHIYNPTADTAYITKLQVRGTPLISYKVEQVREADGESIHQYGLIPFPPVSAQFINNEVQARGYARQMLARYASPTPRYETVSFLIGSMDGGQDALAARVLPLSVGSVIRLTNSVTGHNRTYVIVGEQHTINGVYHRVTWVLRPSDRTKVWILDTSQLDLSTVLAL